MIECWISAAPIRHHGRSVATFVPIALALVVPRNLVKAKKGSPRRIEFRIYALVDPRDSRVRYVGVTSRTLADRLRFHLEKPTNARTRAWFSDLARAGLRPYISLLEHVGADEWED